MPGTFFPLSRHENRNSVSQNRQMKAADAFHDGIGVILSTDLFFD